MRDSKREKIILQEEQQKFKKLKQSYHPLREASQNRNFKKVDKEEKENKKEPDPFDQKAEELKINQYRKEKIVMTSVELKEDLENNYLNKPYISTLQKLLENDSTPQEIRKDEDVEEAARKIQLECFKRKTRDESPLSAIERVVNSQAL